MKGYEKTISCNGNGTFDGSIIDRSHRDSKFTGAKTKKFSGTSVTLSNLSKKTYYFTVRAYKKSGNEMVYGKWSAVKKAAVKGASTITYKTSKFTLQLPASWKGCYVAEQSTFDGMSWLAFYEKNCYQELDQQGGWLFSIGVYKDDSYTEMPSYEVIKKKGSKTYVALYPTDVQFDGASKKAQTNYRKMTQQIEQVLKSIKLLKEQVSVILIDAEVTSGDDK